MHHPDNLSNKYHEQKFCIKFASQCSIEQKYLTQNVKKYKLKIKNKQISVQNFSTESAKLQNQQFITCYSLLHFILLKMTNNKHLRWVISTNQSCSRFVTHFDDKPKILTYRQISPNIFFLKKCPMKIKVSQGGTGLQKRGPVLIRLSEFDNSYARWCCESSCFCIYHYSK